jgi:transcriptional regulator with XRE-family HTH domain
MSIRRKELRMAQARLASLTGISQPRLSAIERQHAEPTEEELKAIAAVLCEKDPDMLMLPYADYILQRQGVKRPGG